MSDLDAVSERLRQKFPSVRAPSDQIWSQCPALKVIDCALSLNRHYDKVVSPRVQQFARTHPEIKELSDLRRLISRYESPLEFSKAELNYADSRRADTLVGVLDCLLDLQRDFQGETEAERLEAWAAWARPGDYLTLSVRGFGLAGFQYLRMLFGAQTTKPDVHIVRFVSENVGRKVSDVQALNLLERAAVRTGLPVRDLDVAIWEASARTKE